MSEKLGLAIGAISKKIQELQKQGKQISNFTIGDFDPIAFKSPLALRKEIEKAGRKCLTNYPDIGGELDLKMAIKDYTLVQWKQHYLPEQIIVTSGARSSIYLAMKVLLNPGDELIVSYPNWNLDNYLYLLKLKSLPVFTTEKNRFLLQGEDLTEKMLKQAKMICINVPHNPSGSVYFRGEFSAIAQKLIIENRRRLIEKERPLWVLIDGIYGVLTGDTGTFLSGSEELLPWVILIDGASKSFAATGLRVGWALGCEEVIEKMTRINGFIGAWAAKPIQLGLASFLGQTTLVDVSIVKMREKLQQRQKVVEKYLFPLKKANYLNYIASENSIYFCVDLSKILERLVKSNLDDWLLNQVGIGLVNFSNFGLSGTGWYRGSLVNTSFVELNRGLKRLNEAVLKLGG